MSSADAASTDPALLPDGSGVVTPGGLAVHIDHRRGTSPAVLLLGGCGVPSTVWDAVADRLSGPALVRMDRPGLLGTPWPGTIPRLADEVVTLAGLIALVGGPVVVVAHALAGLHAEALVRQHPATVAALVLLDGSVEWEPEPAQDPTRWLRTARTTHRALGFGPLARLGPLVERALVPAPRRRRTRFDPGSALDRDSYRRPDTVASVIAEQAAYGQQVLDLVELRRTRPWPGPPTVVLTSAADGDHGWTADQRRLAGLLDARHVVVEGARRLVMLDRPDIVAEQVRALVDPKDDRD